MGDTSSGTGRDTGSTMGDTSSWVEGDVGMKANIWLGIRSKLTGGDTE